MMVDDNTLRKLWKAAGGRGMDGSFDATMPQASLLVFLRTIIKGQSRLPPEFPTVERSHPDGYLMASSVRAELCDSCNSVHINLKGEAEEIFAVAALSADHAAGFAREILDAARESKGRQQ